VKQVAETAVAPATLEAIQEELANIWRRILNLDSVGFDEDYFDLGGDSSLAVQMFAQIEKIFKVKLPLATLYDAPTIEQMARALCGEEKGSDWSPLVEIQTSGSRTPFFCFHGAGGNVLSYRKLSHCLGDGQPFYGLQSQGLDGNAPLLTSIEEMAALYVREIRKVQPHGPYLLGGYCMGGTIAYEAAHQLHAAGEGVAMLALLDTMNWHKVPLTLWSKTSHAVQKVLFHIAGFLHLDRGGRAEFLKEKLEALRKRIPVWIGTLRSPFARDAVRANASVLLARTWKTNDRAAWNYVPRPYPGTLLDFRPAKQYRVFSKPDLKWERLALEGQTTIVLPVYPAGMLSEPFVERLARELRVRMDDAGNTQSLCEVRREYCGLAEGRNSFGIE
jgi:phthiocerol/phenolphthiocerol synthesis type-I polyketide synthase E